MIPALVTGGSGFIGEHLVSELIRRGRQVRVLDISLPRRMLRTVDYRQASVLDADALQSALSGISEVYHLAGLPGMWRKDSSEFHAINCVGTERVLAAARKAGAGRVLHCSTESILFYASSDHVSAEEARLSADDMPGPYTRSKMLADQLALNAAASDLHVVVGCPTMPIGSSDRNVTPPTAMLQHFLAGGPLRLYFDFIVNLVDVRDVAVGLILALERGRPGHRYIIGGECLRLAEVLSLIAAISGARKRFVPVPGWLAELAGSTLELTSYVLGGPPKATAEGVRIARRATALSIDKARRELGYAPRSILPALNETVACFLARAQPNAGMYQVNPTEPVR